MEDSLLRTNYFDIFVSSDLSLVCNDETSRKISTGEKFMQNLISWYQNESFGIK